QPLSGALQLWHKLTLVPAQDTPVHFDDAQQQFLAVIQYSWKGIFYVLLTHEGRTVPGEENVAAPIEETNVCHIIQRAQVPELDVRKTYIRIGPNDQILACSLRLKAPALQLELLVRKRAGAVPDQCFRQLFFTWSDVKFDPLRFQYLGEFRVNRRELNTN